MSLSDSPLGFGPPPIEEGGRELKSTPPEPEGSGGVPAAVKIGIVFTVLAGVVGFLLFGSGANEALVYSKLVDEVMANPAEFQGRTIRVEGDLREGSIERRDEPCEWRFMLTKENYEMPVRFPECVVPDTFRDGFGITVIVEGKLEGGTFVATQVVPRCPSKYEMEERLEAGEPPPHIVTDATGLEEPEPGALEPDHPDHQDHQDSEPTAVELQNVETPNAFDE
jgi:cytochrome c-type biogenesis protein CcmE